MRLHRERPITRIFTVRDRPVGFRSSHFGGELVALERGYFPASSTGYRSLASEGALRNNPQAAEILPAFLEKLAADRDLERRSLLRRLVRGPQPGRVRLGNFINASMDAETAVNAGFFAPDNERPALWGGAYRLICLITLDERFQPEPNNRAWTPEQCARSLEELHGLKGWLERLARGDFAEPRACRRYYPPAYFELPPKPAGERAFSLPSVASQLALFGEQAHERCPAPRPVAAMPSAAPTAKAGAQMSLF